MFEALKRRRKDKTTVVITHDLSQIEPKDFVYVLKNGSVVEQGFRYDLEAEREAGEEGGGEFRAMLEAQRRTGGFLPETSPFEPPPLDPEEKVHALLSSDAEDSDDDGPEPLLSNLAVSMKHQSLARPALRPATLGNWMFDVVADLTAPRPLAVAARDARRVSRFAPLAADAGADELGAGAGAGTGRRPSSVQVLSYSPPTPGLAVPPSAHTVASRRFSLQFTPTSPTFSSWSVSKTSFWDDDEEEEEEGVFELEKDAVKRSGSHAVGSREKRVRKRWDDAKVPPLTSVSRAQSPEGGDKEEYTRPRFLSTVREIFPTIPYKPLLFLGLFTCLASGAMTPVFSFLLSRLLFEVSTGAHNVATINYFGGLVLGIAALDGLLMGLKYFLMETAGNAWVLRIRRRAFASVLAQDTRWFDRGANARAGLVQTLVKDGDDARGLVAVVLGQACVVLAMVGVGLVWAMVRGWQLTLVGVAVAPVFAGVMALQAALVARCELRNKRAREEVAKGYYDVCVFFFVLGVVVLIYYFFL